MKLLAFGVFIAVLVVIGKTPEVIRLPMFAAFAVLCIIVGIWRRAQPTASEPANWGPPTP